MATYITAGLCIFLQELQMWLTFLEPTIGELRWIGRLNPTLLPNDDFSQASDIGGGTAVEGSDVYLVNGQTRSKFYSSQRFIDDKVHCEASYIFTHWDED